MESLLLGSRVSVGRDCEGARPQKLRCQRTEWSGGTEQGPGVMARIMSCNTAVTYIPNTAPEVTIPFLEKPSLLIRPGFLSLSEKGGVQAPWALLCAEFLLFVVQSRI